MKIERIAVNVFEHPTRIVRDSAGHAHASRDAAGKAKLAMLRVGTEDGAEGYSFGPPEVVRPFVIDGFVRKELAGHSALAAKQCGVRRFIGFEIDEQYLAESRANLQLPPAAPSKKPTRRFRSRPAQSELRL